MTRKRKLEVVENQDLQVKRTLRETKKNKEKEGKKDQNSAHKNAVTRKSVATTQPLEADHNPPPDRAAANLQDHAAPLEKTVETKDKVESIIAISLRIAQKIEEDPHKMATISTRGNLTFNHHHQNSISQPQLAHAHWLSN